MGLIKTGIVSRKGFGGGTKLYAIGLHYDNIKDEELVQYMTQNLQIGVASAVAAVHAFRKVVHLPPERPHHRRAPSWNLQPQLQRQAYP